jgi:hypothetical protein
MDSKSVIRTLLLLATCSFTSALFAQQTKTVEGGLTTVQLSDTFLSALSSLDVTPGVIEPTHLHNGIVSFPITGGAIDPDTAKGNVLHSGGLTLTAHGKEVRLQSFLIDTAGKPLVITGLVVVSGRVLGRVPLFDLTLPSGVTLPLSTGDGFRLDVKDVTAKLDPEAAAALNGVFETRAFKGGLEIGTAQVDAFIDPAKE